MATSSTAAPRWNRPRYAITVVPKRGKVPHGETVVDVTSKGERYRVLSPFHPVGDIPVPGMPGVTSASVEGLWQGLKVFAPTDPRLVHGVDTASFRNKSAKNLKRTARKYGAPPLGHFAGEGRALLPYAAAQADIYIPAYEQHLRRLEAYVLELAALADQGPLVLVDYDTNSRLGARKALSHAHLIRWYIVHGGTLADYARNNQ